MDLSEEAIDKMRNASSKKELKEIQEFYKEKAKHEIEKAGKPAYSVCE